MLWILRIRVTQIGRRNRVCVCVCYDKKPDGDGEEIAENAKLSFL